ncbi:hypothetical protein [Halomonas sp.]|uniref:hypothetical protein n=1 Tax=Halomonas sp. TaxID=1486246 RepID=UPI00356A84D4
MPVMPPGTQAYPCPAHEMLLLAHQHESREMDRYRGLALSFLTSHPKISRLMAALGIECEQRMSALEALAHKLKQRDCLPAAIDSPEQWPAARRLHLFISDDAMAAQVLSNALAFAQHSRQFSELMVPSCQLPELEALLVQFIEQKSQECQLLEECQEASGPGAARA